MGEEITTWARKHAWWIFGGAIGAAIVILFSFITIFIIMVSETSCDKNADDPESSAVLSGAGGEWTQKGTKAYNTAKEVFDSWVKVGMSGAQAASIVGNVGGAEDTGFVLDQREAGGSGGGLYQFTPYTKYLSDSKSDKSWSVINQRDVVMHLEPGTIKAFFNSTKSATPEDAAIKWMDMYERPAAWAKAQTAGKRQAAARKAYELFGGASISGKDSLLGDDANAAAVGIDADNQSNGCSTQTGGVSGKWGWPFKSVPKSGPTGHDEGQQFGHTSFIRASGGDFHDGYDWGSARYSGDVLAVHGGKVYKISYGGSARKWFVDVKSDDGYYETYQEAFSSKSDLAVSEGDEIQTGQKIGTLTTDHLHLGITKHEIEAAQSSWDKDDGTWLDPIKIIKEGINN